MNERGFTLLELTVVVCLLVLLAGMVIPMLPGMGPSGLEREGGRMAGFLRQLYNEAALRGRPLQLEFDPVNGSYQARVIKEDGTIGGLEGRLGGTHYLPDGIRFAELKFPERPDAPPDTLPYLLFLPGGWVDAATIVLTDDAQRQLALKLNPLTGIAKLERGANAAR